MSSFWQPASLLLSPTPISRLCGLGQRTGSSGPGPPSWRYRHISVCRIGPRASQLRRAQSVQHGTDGQIPAAIPGRLGCTEPSCAFLHRQALCERDEHMCDVGVVAAQDASVGAPADAPDDELPHRAAGPELVRAWIEISEGPREHHLGQHRVPAGEPAEGLDDTDEVGARIAGFRELVEVTPEQAETLEEHFPNEPGLSAEQLVDSRGCRPGLLGDLPG